MKVILIEDEKLTAKDLANSLMRIDADIQIIAQLASVEEALDYFALHKEDDADVIFSDIELGDGLSFEIFERIENKIPIVFCTAYNQYALEAFNTLGIDYILKPFNTNALENALNKLKLLKGSALIENDTLSSLLKLLKQPELPQRKSILANVGDKIIPIKSEEIALFFIENEIVYAVCFNGKKIVLSQNMDTLEKMFVDNFFRANRQYLINRNAVKAASHYFNRKLLVHLTVPFENQIIIGKLKTGAFTSWLAST